MHNKRSYDLLCLSRFAGLRYAGSQRTCAYWFKSRTLLLCASHPGDKAEGRNIRRIVLADSPVFVWRGLCFAHNIYNKKFKSMFLCNTLKCLVRQLFCACCRFLIDTYDPSGQAWLFSVLQKTRIASKELKDKALHMNDSSPS